MRARTGRGRCPSIRGQSASCGTLARAGVAQPPESDERQHQRDETVAAAEHRPDRVVREVAVVQHREGADGRAPRPARSRPRPRPAGARPGRARPARWWPGCRPRRPARTAGRAPAPRRTGWRSAPRPGPSRTARRSRRRRSAPARPRTEVARAGRSRAGSATAGRPEHPAAATPPPRCRSRPPRPRPAPPGPAPRSPTGRRPAARTPTPRGRSGTCWSRAAARRRTPGPRRSPPARRAARRASTTAICISRPGGRLATVSPIPSTASAAGRDVARPAPARRSRAGRYRRTGIRAGPCDA